MSDVYVPSSVLGLIRSRGVEAHVRILCACTEQRGSKLDTEAYASWIGNLRAVSLNRGKTDCIWSGAKPVQLDNKPFRLEGCASQHAVLPEVWYL